MVPEDNCQYRAALSRKHCAFMKRKDSSLGVTVPPVREVDIKINLNAHAGMTFISDTCLQQKRLYTGLLLYPGPYGPIDETFVPTKLSYGLMLVDYPSMTIYPPIENVWPMEVLFDFPILSFTYGQSFVEADCKHEPHLEWSLSKALSHAALESGQGGFDWVGLDRDWWVGSRAWLERNNNRIFVRERTVADRNLVVNLIELSIKDSDVIVVNERGPYCLRRSQSERTRIDSCQIQSWGSAGKRQLVPTLRAWRSFPCLDIKPIENRFGPLLTPAEFNLRSVVTVER
ncbi:hypothetical protein V1478_014347 [Vespula squamosa]|uniref:Uncharacterized protein n=1 Tax=Vespula squamosa TaxID=30214 RepID=A0ABD2A7U6_VESSQ